MSAKNVFCLAFLMLEVYELSLAHSVLKSKIILLATTLCNGPARLRGIRPAPSMTGNMGDTPSVFLVMGGVGLVLLRTTVKETQGCFKIVNKIRWFTVSGDIYLGKLFLTPGTARLYISSYYKCLYLLVLGWLDFLYFFISSSCFWFILSYWSAW